MTLIRRTGLSLTALATVALLLTACGSGGSGDSSSHNAAGGAAVAPSAAPGSGKAASNPLPGNAGHAIVYTADLQLRVGDVARTAARANSLVSAAGGYVASENDTTDPASSSISYKVPVPQYQAVLNQLGGLGHRLSLQQSSQDVTQQVADVNSRVSSAQAAIAAFRKLMDRASSVSDIISLEQEITTREGDLESLEAQQKSLAAQTTDATVNLELTPQSAQTAKKRHHDGGFLGGLSSGWSAFLTVVWALVTALGAMLPFLVVAAAVALPVLRVRRRRTTAQPPPAQKDEETV